MKCHVCEFEGCVGIGGFKELMPDHIEPLFACPQCGAVRIDGCKKDDEEFRKLCLKEGAEEDG